MASRKTIAPVVTKSERIRDSVRAGIAAGAAHPIADAAREIDVEYGFAYGVAQRAHLTGAGATRRAEPNAKLRAVFAAAHPEWSADRVARSATAYAAGEALPKR